MKDVKDPNRETDIGRFLSLPFSYEEASVSTAKLYFKIANRFENIRSEDIAYAGNTPMDILVRICYMILKLEYIPINIRRGIQIPLLNAKNSCSFDRNNNQGIALLSMPLLFFMIG